MSLYPNSLDSDLELARFENNVTEISAEGINDIRSAIIAIEKALGINIQGNMADLVTRIDKVIDRNGIIKTSALSGKGLISLPINNSQIGSTAAIAESKLDLDYTTSYLYGRISSTNTTVETLQANITSYLNTLVNHYSGVSNKHDGYQITMSSYTRAGLGTDIEKAIHLLDNAFVNHTHISSAHSALNVSVDDTNIKNLSASNVQEALQEMSYSEPDITQHLDRAHDNAILINRRSETENANLNETTLASTVYQTNTSLSNNILQVMRPNTARLMGDLIDFGALDASTADTLRIHAHGLGLGSIDIDISSAIPTDDINDVVEEINSTLHSNTNHYPASCYAVNGRLVVAHNIPGWVYTIEVLSTPTNSAHTALGFSSYADTEYNYADGYCSAYIGGKRIDDLKSLIKMRYDHSAAVDLNLIEPGLENLAHLGFTVGDEGHYLCNITNHDTDSANGTYYIIGYSGDSAFYLNADIPQGEFDLEVIADSVSFDNAATGEIYDVFVERYEDGYGKITKSLRASYNTHSGIDIKSLSPNFSTSVIQWSVSSDETVYFSTTESGIAVSVPSGYTGELEVFAPDNVNSALLQITGALAAAASHSISVSAFAGTDDRLYLSSIHYSGNFGSTLLKYPTDKRKIGGSAENQYQDRLSKLTLNEALSELRNNGIIRGFDIISNTSTAIRVRGGRALIEGKLVDVGTKNVTVDSFTGNKRLLLLNENGDYFCRNIDAGGFDEDSLLGSDGYGDVRGVAVIADFGTTGSALDGTFTDRRLMINKIDRRLYDVENNLNRRLDNLFSATTGAVWAFNLATSSDAYGEFIGGITLSANTGLAHVEDTGFTGGNASVTTRRWEVTDGYVTSAFQSSGQTHLNLMCQINYTSEDGDPFGTSGEVNIYAGFSVVTGLQYDSTYLESGEYKPHHIAPTIVEQYVKVKTIDTTVFARKDICENYVISIPVSLFSNLESNICFDALPRIKITGCDQIDGGATGSAVPQISVGLVRIVGSSYSVAGSILNSDGNSTALAASVGNIL